MKHLKKILALALVAVSLMAVALPAMAGYTYPSSFRGYTNGSQSGSFQITTSKKDTCTSYMINSKNGPTASINVYTSGGSGTITFRAMKGNGSTWATSSSQTMGTNGWTTLTVSGLSGTSNKYYLMADGASTFTSGTCNVDWVAYE